jgi:hypothetical protein
MNNIFRIQIPQNRKNSFYISILFVGRKWNSDIELTIVVTKLTINVNNI